MMTTVSRIRPVSMIFGLILLVPIMLAIQCPKTPQAAVYDLAAGVCYSINTSTGEVVVSGIIKNVGQNVLDFGVTHKVPGPNNTFPQATYVIGADVQGAPHAEIPPVTLTDAGLLLKPGEASRTSTILKLPFHSQNVYSRFEFVVTLKGDQNVSNDRATLFYPGNVTGAELQSNEKQYACPTQ